MGKVRVSRLTPEPRKAELFSWGVWVVPAGRFVRYL